ncbi:unnamed protein product [Moneuplotes crassus]|uniref:Uncharacterized protein n=1 Tax=Euplotes crassus TaxID=5936 RepID=A0AAD1U2B4_EUPCR|nr:unnamed protein product [Moneuplotes crassus]
MCFFRINIFELKLEIKPLFLSERCFIDFFLIQCHYKLLFWLLNFKFCARISIIISQINLELSPETSDDKNSPNFFLPSSQETSLASASLCDKKKNFVHNRKTKLKEALALSQKRKVKNSSKSKQRKRSNSKLRHKLKMMKAYGLKFSKKISMKNKIDIKDIISKLRIPSPSMRTTFGHSKRTSSEQKANDGIGEDEVTAKIGNFKSRLKEITKIYSISFKNLPEGGSFNLKRKSIRPTSSFTQILPSQRENDKRPINYIERNKRIIVTPPTTDLKGSIIDAFSPITTKNTFPKPKEQKNYSKRVLLKNRSCEDIPKAVEYKERSIPKLNKLKAVAQAKYPSTKKVPKKLTRKSGSLRDITKEISKDFEEITQNIKKRRTSVENERENEPSQNEWMSTITSTTNYKLKISSQLPQMSVEDEKQANILKFIFKKNFETDAPKMKKASTLNGYYEKLKKEQDKHKEWELEQRKEMRRNKTDDMNAKAYKDTRSSTPRRPISIILPKKPQLFKKTFTIFEKVFDRKHT